MKLRGYKFRYGLKKIAYGGVLFRGKTTWSLHVLGEFGRFSRFPYIRKKFIFSGLRSLPDEMIGILEEME